MFGLQHKGLLSNVFPFLGSQARQHFVSKKNYYQSRLNRIDSWEKLYKLTQDLNTVLVSDDKQIHFYNVPFGVNQKAIIKQFGKPRHILNNNSKIKDHEVYFYKFNFYGVLAKCEIHFWKNSFFLASYFFNRTIDDVSKDIVDIIFQKYRNGLPIEFENRFQLVDRNNNKLIFEKDVDYVVTYFSGDSQLNRSILDKIQEEEFKRMNSRKARENVLSRAL